MKRGQGAGAVTPQEESTFQRVKQIVVEQLGVDEAEVTADAKFDDDFGVDSLDEIELVMAAEEEFGIEIPDGEADSVTTVKQAAELIDRRIALRKNSKR